MNIDYSKALKLAVCCKESYRKDFDNTNMMFSSWTDKAFPINIPETDTQVAILKKSSEITVVFPGTSSYTDWITNFTTFKEYTTFYQQVIQREIEAKKQKTYPYHTNNKSGSSMHTGFVKSYLSVRDQIHEYINSNYITNVTVTGHSLGGALATLCVLDIQYNFAEKLSFIEAYTFGAPKVGNHQFCCSYNHRVCNSYHFVHGMDIIPSLPRWWQGYRKTETQLHIGSRFSLNFITALLRDHEISRYINFFKTKVADSENKKDLLLVD
jgi:predicted lipase